MRRIASFWLAVAGNYSSCPSQRMKMSAKSSLGFTRSGLSALTVSAEITRRSNDRALSVKPRGGKKLQGSTSGEGGPCLFFQPEPNCKIPARSLWDEGLDGRRSCNHLSEVADPVDGRHCGNQSRKTVGTSERGPEGNLQAFLGNFTEHFS